ncbi:MAG: DUF5309 family protein [Patescibacteria group bacterium]|nr:DUF5309 family protein [Patescibacteria group bacterium]
MSSLRKESNKIVETGLGRVRVHTHRYVQQAGDTTGRVLALNPEKCRIAYLEKPYVDTGLARKGDYTSRAVIGKLTTEVRNQDSNWFAYGYADGT